MCALASRELDGLRGCWSKRSWEERATTTATTTAMASATHVSSEGKTEDVEDDDDDDALAKGDTCRTCVCGYLGAWCVGAGGKLAVDGFSVIRASQLAARLPFFWVNAPRNASAHKLE